MKAGPNDSRQKRFGALLVLACALALLVHPGRSSAAPEKVRLQLKWYHQFQFAGYYAAQAQGFYRDEGLEVELIEGARERHPERMVREGQADFGILDGGDLIYHRLRGEPLIAVATIFQHSPYVLIARKASGIRHPADLVARTVLINQTHGDAAILAMFQREGIRVRSTLDTEPVRFAAHSWNYDDLLAGRVDAMSAYTTEIPAIRRLYGFEPAQLAPRDYGIDFYGDTLFTRSAYLQDKPQVVERFRRASLKGWAYAMANPGEMADLIVTLASARPTRLDRQALLDEAAAMENIVVPKLVALGNMNPGRWQQMARVYQELGMVASLDPLDGFVYEQDQEKQAIIRRLRMVGFVLAAISLMAVGSLVWLRLLRSQVRLRTQELTDEIAERKLAEEKLELAASVFSHAREGITITAADGTIIDVNEAFTRITGYRRDEVLGKNPRLMKSNHHDAAFYAAMWRDLVEKGYWNGEIWNRRKNGELYAEILTISAVSDESGKTQHYVALFSDISPMKEHEKQLETMAHYDLLTTLPNRALLADRLHQAMAQAQRRGQPLAVAYLDLDGFKAVNDRHGHKTGDQLLIALAARMKQALREGDTLARIGGDEFVAVLFDLSDLGACMPMLNRLLAAAAAPLTIGELTLKVSASLGVTFYPQADEVDPDQLLRQADQAMYQAKLAGKNRFHLFDAAQDRDLRGRHESLARVREALMQREFVLYYQPKVNMRSGRVIGAEALIRWQHPEKGLLPPHVFLPVIDDHPLAIALGDWVIDSALSQIERWRADGLDLPVSVNVGARQLQHAHFTARLRELLAQHPLVGSGDLEIEVLETSALEDIRQVSQVIEECRAIGVSFSLDDFGTGYSSLSYLKQLAVKQLKIDQSFVRNMLDDPDDLAILDGVLGLATAFRREVLAEGVETVEHGTMLLQLGCELAQGYGIARPMPAEALPGWIERWQPDAAWSQRPPVGRENLPALFAGTEHRAWMLGLEKYLRGETSAPPPLDPTHCRFGRWLASDGRERHGRQTAFSAIELLHEEIHTRAGQLHELHSRGCSGEALAGLDELRANRHALLGQLEVLLERQA